MNDEKEEDDKIFETAKDQLPSEDSISERDLEDSESKAEELLSIKQPIDHNSNRYQIDPCEIAEVL